MPTRRDVLRVGGESALGLALPDLLRACGAATRIISVRVASRGERKGYEDGDYPRA